MTKAHRNEIRSQALVLIIQFWTQAGMACHYSTKVYKHNCIVKIYNCFKEYSCVSQLDMPCTCNKKMFERSSQTNDEKTGYFVLVNSLSRSDESAHLDTFK